MTDDTKLTADDWLNLLDSLYPGHAERLIDLIGRELFGREVERWGPPKTEAIQLNDFVGLVTPVYMAISGSDLTKSPQQFSYWNDIDTALGIYVREWFFPEITKDDTL